MRIRAWSSDVCSSDLHLPDAAAGAGAAADPGVFRRAGLTASRDWGLGIRDWADPGLLSRSGLVSNPQSRIPNPGVENETTHPRPRHRRSRPRSEEHTPELQSIKRRSYAVFSLQ